MNPRLKFLAPAAALLTAAAMSVASSPAMAVAAQDDRAATVKTEANLRTEPNTTSKVRKVMPVGTEVSVTCWTQGEPTYGTDKYGSMWLYLPAGGWVHSRLVTPVEVPPCSSETSTLYDNCDEARDAGATPVLAGSRGYGLHLDRDRDGVGCERED